MKIKTSKKNKLVKTTTVEKKKIEKMIVKIIVRARG